MRVLNSKIKELIIDETIIAKLTPNKNIELQQNLQLALVCSATQSKMTNSYNITVLSSRKP